MIKQKQAALRAASRLLDYPDESFHQEALWLEEGIHETFSSDTDKNKATLLEALNALKSIPLKELQELYVETFDYKDTTGLYLTAHELGDSRKRGTALIELQNMVKSYGYETTSGELSDYIPMLLELLSVMPEDEAAIRLRRRIACAVYRVLNHMPADQPYRHVLKMLMKTVFDSPSSEDIAQFDKEREETDTEPLPYPMLYQ